MGRRTSSIEFWPLPLPPLPATRMLRASRAHSSEGGSTCQSVLPPPECPSPPVPPPTPPPPWGAQLSSHPASEGSTVTYLQVVLFSRVCKFPDQHRQPLSHDGVPRPPASRSCLVSLENKTKAIKLGCFHHRESSVYHPSWPRCLRILSLSSLFPEPSTICMLQDVEPNLKVKPSVGGPRACS